jgi:hypothetical protein
MGTLAFDVVGKYWCAERENQIAVGQERDNPDTIGR